MSALANPTRTDFERVRRAVNRWRADHAPFLTRDEAVLLILGRWLACEGYLQPENRRSAATNDAQPVVQPGAVTTPRGRAEALEHPADPPHAAHRLGGIRDSSAMPREPRRRLPSFRSGIAR